MRRIEESKHANALRYAERTTNLNGEQIFVRSCNTCHPGGKEGMGPRLESMDTKFPTDDVLRKYIRKGKGMMPSQPIDDINETEMNSLIAFLRVMNDDLKEDTKQRIIREAEKERKRIERENAKKNKKR